MKRLLKHTILFALVALVAYPVLLCLLGDLGWVRTARTEMASFVDSLTAPMAVINAMLVALGMQRREALAEHFRQLEAIWDTYAVYIEGEEDDGSDA